MSDHVRSLDRITIPNPCDADADLTIKDKDGKTAMAIARENDNEGVIKLLQAHRAPE